MASTSGYVSKILCLVATFAAPLSGPVLALDDWVCSSRLLAYEKSGRLSRAEKRSAVEIGRREAAMDLAARAWMEGISYRHSVRVLDGSKDDRESVRSTRLIRRFPPELSQGEYRESHDDKGTWVEYCVPSAKFEAAERRLRAERQQDEAQIRAVLAQIDRDLRDGNLSRASQAISEGIALVNERVLDDVLYQSPLSGEQRTAYVWLQRWQEQAGRDASYVQHLTAQASSLLANHRLQSAKDMYGRIQAIDARNVPAAEGLASITALQARRTDLLSQALGYADRGRFAAADARVDEARGIDVEDLGPVIETETAVAGKRAAFLSVNPRGTIGLGALVGNIGFDDNATQNSISDALDWETSVGSGTGIFLSGTYRFARTFRLFAAGEWADAPVSLDLPWGDEPQASIRLKTLMAGVDYRTIHPASGRPAFIVGVGVARIDGEYNDFTVEPLSPSGSATGGYIQLAMEGRYLQLFVRHGLGFSGSDEPNQGLGWTDGTVFGVTVFLGLGTAGQPPQ
jgi:hypothetical protein